MGSFLVKLLADPGEFKFYSGNSEGQVGSVSTANSFGQKSIPFGKDRPGGGSSNQPYVKGIGLTATGTTTVASAWNNFIASFASNNASFFTAGTVYPLLDSSNYGAGKLSGFGSSTKYLWGNTIEQIAGVSNLTKSMIYAVDNLPNIPDSIIRGGLKGLPRSVIDATRLTKYFLDYKNPSGVLFIAKQNLLSRTEVKTEPSRAGLAYLEGVLNGGIYTPISTIGQAATNFAGIHLNKQGIDPTGIIPQLSIRDYQTVVYNRNQGDISAENDKGYYKRTARKIEKIDKLKSRLEEAKKGFEVNKIFDEGVEARRKYTVTYGGKTYNSFYEAARKNYRS